MGMPEGTHDTLVYRLAQILIKLNQGEKLNPQLLADEFGVSLRTIQRDLNVRFGYMPLLKSSAITVWTKHSWGNLIIGISSDLRALQGSTAYSHPCQMTF